MVPWGAMEVALGVDFIRAHTMVASDIDHMAMVYMASLSYIHRHYSYHKYRISYNGIHKMVKKWQRYITQRSRYFLSNRSSKQLPVHQHIFYIMKQFYYRYVDIGIKTHRIFIV